MDIAYRDDVRPDAAQAIEVFRRSTLGERRPLDRPDIFAGMMANAGLLITAWEGDLLVGIARSLTDRVYVAYLADLAVDARLQRRGIGKRLIAETRRRLAPTCMLVLLAAPQANGYYEPLGFRHNPRAWVLKGDEPVAPDMR